MIVGNMWKVVMRCRHLTERLSWPTLTGTFGRYVRDCREKLDEQDVKPNQSSRSSSSYASLMILYTYEGE